MCGFYKLLIIVTALIPVNALAENCQIKNLENVQSTYNYKTTKFGYDVYCSPDKREYSIKVFGGALTAKEKEMGAVQARRCDITSHGASHGIFLNDQYFGQNPLEHECDLGDGYKIMTMINYDHSWKTEASVVGSFYFLFGHTHEERIFPYATKVMLLRGNQELFVREQVGGDNRSLDSIAVDGDKSTVTYCANGTYSETAKDNCYTKTFSEMTANPFITKYQFPIATP